MKKISERHIAQLIANRMSSYSDKVMMRYKLHDHWVSFTGKEVNENVFQLANALYQYGVRPEDKIGIMGQNSPIWTFSDLAILNTGAVSVPIYATNSHAQIDYILKDAQIKLLFIGAEEQYKEAVALLNDPDSPLETIILFDDSVQKQNENTIYLKDFVANYPTVLSEDIIKLQQSFNGALLASIIYTSGTTGEPKGAMLTHENMVFACENHDIKYHLSDEEESLAFLPLSHIFERLWTFYVYHKGMCNTYCTDPKQIAHLLKEVKPTVMCSVPRLYEKIYDMIFQRAEKASFVKKNLFRWAINTALRYESKRSQKQKISFGLKKKYALADRLVLGKIREQLGGRLKFMPCGGAFLADHLTHFFRAVNLPIVFGYGLSETTATVSSYDIDSYKIGSVGKLMPNTEVKIGPNNEIWVKSKAVMKGYFQKAKENLESFEGEWFKTGDAGYIDEDNYLFLTDRIKDLIKTSGGKYIAPQLVENTLLKSSFIEQIMLVGEGKPFASALIIPNLEALKQKFPKFDFHQDVIPEKEIKAFYQSIIDELQAQLAPFERIKKFTLMTNEFSQEKNEMTPTFKLKRKMIMMRYEHLIRNMYA